MSATAVTALGGVAAGAATVLAAQKFNTGPGWTALGIGGMGLATMKVFKDEPWARELGAGAIVGAAVMGAVPLVVGLGRQKSAGTASASAPASAPRAAPGDGYITRGELNDALGKLADAQRDVQQQQTCDLVTALRGEIRRVVAETTGNPVRPVADMPSASRRPPNLYAVPDGRFGVSPDAAAPSSNDTRDAAGDEDAYARNAYGEDLRDAAGDDYTDSAYGAGARNAEADDYARTYDERDADGERDAGYDERDGDGERDAGGYDERDGDGERDADGE